MFGTLLRIVLVVVVVAAVAAFFLGYQFGGRDTVRDTANETDYAVGTTGTDTAVDRARDAGARVGESLAVGADRAQQMTADGTLTAKIKSKMALDDTVQALDIDVDTSNGVVTLSGTVESSEQRQRATRLARETDGVTSVVDQLTIY